MSLSKTLILALTASISLLADAASIRQRGAKPTLPYDENTSSYCTWWVDYDGSIDCATMLADNWAELPDFRRWNPTIGENCAGLTIGRSYCVEALFEVFPPLSSEAPPKPSSSSVVPPASSSVKPPASSSVIPPASSSVKPPASSSVKPPASSTPAPASSSVKPPVTSTPKPTPTPTPTPKPSSSSVKPPASSTSVGNGIQTPSPAQPTIVSNCDKFYFVQKGDQCGDIAAKFGITLAKFLAWNPSAGSSCGGLWADAYACVSIIGEDATPVPSPTPSPTKPGNGISTPQPPQPSMVSNCDKFYLVKKGENCATIIAANGITLAQFTTWNPAAGSTCGGLWADAYACVSIVGHEPSKPSPSPTNPGNGVQTPSPIQPGMVTNCKKFDFVKKGETCDILIKRNNVTLANFTKWNTGVGSTCTGMWAESYVCVGV